MIATGFTGRGEPIVVAMHERERKANDALRVIVDGIEQGLTNDEIVASAREIL